jgi:hypothetical protein
MEKDLKDWLEIQFYKDNIRKYHKYFDEWVSNVTLDQIDGLRQQMVGMITQSKVQH